MSKKKSGHSSNNFSTQQVSLMPSSAQKVMLLNENINIQNVPTIKFEFFLTWFGGDHPTESFIGCLRDAWDYLIDSHPTDRHIFIPLFDVMQKKYPNGPLSSFDALFACYYILPASVRPYFYEVYDMLFSMSENTHWLSSVSAKQLLDLLKEGTGSSLDI